MTGNSWKTSGAKSFFGPWKRIKNKQTEKKREINLYLNVDGYEPNSLKFSLFSQKLVSKHVRFENVQQKQSKKSLTVFGDQNLCRKKFIGNRLEGVFIF